MFVEFPVGRFRWERRFRSGRAAEWLEGAGAGRVFSRGRPGWAGAHTTGIQRGRFPGAEAPRLTSEVPTGHKTLAYGPGAIGAPAVVMPKGAAASRLPSRSPRMLGSPPTILHSENGTDAFSVRDLASDRDGHATDEVGRTSWFVR